MRERLNILKSKKIQTISRRKCLMTLILSFLILFVNLHNNKLYGGINNKNSESVNNLPDYKGNLPIFASQTSSNEYSGIGAHQNVTEFGQGFFQNNEINVSNSGNASIIVPNNWEAKEILCNVTNIYEYDKLWINETFNNGIDKTYWSNTTTGDSTYFTVGYYSNAVGDNDSIYMQFDEDIAGIWAGATSYINYTFNLDREEIKYKNWYLNFDVKWINYNDSLNDWRNPPGGSKFYCNIRFQTGASVIENQFNLHKPIEYTNNTWFSEALTPFTPELYNFDPPANVSISFGYYFRDDGIYDPPGRLKIYFDNITFNLQTIPKPSQINLSITDSTHGITKKISDINGYGLGTISFNNSWSGTVGGTKHEFSFSSNSSGKVYVNTDFFVNATSCSFTTTELGIKGSEFIVENGTDALWTMYFPVSIPGSYQTDYYFNMSKPMNWNVTHLIDPYGNDKISQVSETSGPGNTTLVIPNDIIVNGRWKIVVESPNYVLNATVWKWAESTWEKNASFKISDIIKINATVDNSLIPDLTQTNASLLIYYPNGTLWSQATQELSVDSSGKVEFSSFTLGANNASAGKYIVNIHWNDKNITQVGLFVLNFEVTHNTALNRANDQAFLVTPIYTGDTVLIKVNYTDIDWGLGIIGADVNYTIDNETIITGDMIYYGGGIYIAEIDTSGLKNGIYNVSVSANKTYYKTLYKEKLIQLEITERTTLTSPQIGGVNAPWGSNVSIEVFYRDSFSQGISGAIIDCDWTLSSFTIQPGIPGQYEIILNTTISQFGTYLLEINASKDGYENQKIFISVNVRNIYTNLIYTQPDPVGFKSNVTFQVEYGDIEHNVLISGANITISSILGSQYWNSNNFLSEEISFGTYKLTFNSSLFGSGGTFGIYVTANKTNYANATVLINIFIEDISTYIDDIFINGQNKTLDKSIIVPIQSIVNISVKYIEAVSYRNIENATVEIIGGSFSDNFTKLPNQYNISIDTRKLGMGVKILTIFAKKEGYSLASLDITIIVRSINVTIDTELGENVIEINRGESYTLKIVLKNEDFGGNIINASVKYSWQFGYGELEDLDNDGVYEKPFNDIPEGTFTITITASKGYDYDFEPFEITLIVRSPEVKPKPDWSWLIYVLGSAIIGLVAIFGLYIKYWRFPPFVRKVRKLRTKIRKDRKTKPLTFQKREELVEKGFRDQISALEIRQYPPEKVDKIEEIKNLKNGGS